MNLERAFELLRLGVEIAYPEPKWAEKREDLYEILGQSLAAYRRGDRIAGAHLVQDFREMIFKE